MSYCSLICLILAGFWFQEIIFPSDLKSDCKTLDKEKLQSILLQLAMSDHKENFAKDHDIVLYDGKVKVFIYFDPATSPLERAKVLESHRVLIEKTSEPVMRVLVLVGELLPLSKEPIILFISLPDKPIIH